MNDASDSVFTIVDVFIEFGEVLRIQNLYFIALEGLSLFVAFPFAFDRKYIAKTPHSLHAATNTHLPFSII